MNPQEFETLLNELNACKEAKEWCKGKSLQQAWNESRRSDWMLWLVNNTKTDATDKELRLIAVKCARQVQHLMKDQRSINALDVAEKFATGEATQDELGAASAAASAAANAAAWDDASAAAWDAQSDIIREFLPMINILK